VKRGEKAIELCMPITMKRTVKETGPDGNDVETEAAFKRFVFRRNWFMLAQTDGAAYVAPAIPAWDRARALKMLTVEEIPFEMMNGNCQGYAKGRQIAINPLAQMPAKTTFHELAHLCCLRSYVVLRGQAVWSKATCASEPHIGCRSRYCSLEATTHSLDGMWRPARS
jgi:hypothetical protein